MKSSGIVNKKIANLVAYGYGVKLTSSIGYLPLKLCPETSVTYIGKVSS